VADIIDLQKTRSTILFSKGAVDEWERGKQEFKKHGRIYLWLGPRQASGAWTEVSAVHFAILSKTPHRLMTQFLHLIGRDMNISFSFIYSLYFGDRSWVSPFQCKYTAESSYQGLLDTTLASF